MRWTIASQSTPQILSNPDGLKLFMKQIGNVVCAVIVNNDEILIAQRNKMGSLGGFWEFPGGKVEKKESNEDALHRELLEELDLEITIVKKLDPVEHSSENYTLTLIPYLCTVGGRGIVVREHQSVKWTVTSKFDEFEFAPADIPIVEQLKILNINELLVG